MALADAPPARPPSPDECDHPAPVEGIMAHEFAHFDGAIGPEGVRRTVTYYGPVVGGLPIDAWHCEKCGLLRLSFPDGRTEERRLFPGPQPGLIAVPTAVAPERILFGMQARVSGLSVSSTLSRRLAAEVPVQLRVLQLPRIVLPAWDAVTWLLVLGMSCVTFMLLLLGILAVYTYSTPSIVGPLAIVAVCSFVGLVVFALGVAAVRHFFPAEPLSPSIAVAARGTPQLNGATRTAVVLLTVSVLGFLASGVLAIYTYATPGAEGPVLALSLACAVVAMLIKLADVAWRHFGTR